MPVGQRDTAATQAELLSTDGGADLAVPAASAGTGAATVIADLLTGVSRTFALTIPVLPAGLREAVSIGYLLCRIADTIEDEPALAPAERRRLHAAFAAAVAGVGTGREFGAALTPHLSNATSSAERELVRRSADVIAAARALPPPERQALERCVAVMCSGMDRFQPGAGPRGLADVGELDAYCYAVAGVVGEMLTELFCSSAPDLSTRRAELAALAVPFGQGLQMTNILKDVWEDLARGFCWLPRDVFAQRGYDLDRLTPGLDEPAFRDALGELIAIARGHLESALRYVTLVPPAHVGIRRFCLRALGMAVLTLRRIDARRGFTGAAEVKISRRNVRAVVAATDAACASDRWLGVLFGAAAAALPAARRPVHP